MKTQMERDVAIRFNQDASTERELEAGIGIDHGTLLVRRLGLRGAKQYEVWAGKTCECGSKAQFLSQKQSGGGI